MEDEFGLFETIDIKTYKKLCFNIKLIGLRGHFMSTLLKILTCVTALGLFSSSKLVAKNEGPFALHDGLEITRAFTSEYGPDAEEYNKITNVTSESFDINYSDTRGTTAKRRVFTVDRRTSRNYLIGFDPRVSFIVPGTTSLGISATALDELRRSGRTAISLTYDTRLSTIGGSLSLVQRNFKMPVLIESTVVEIPAIRARGEFRSGSRTGFGDFYFSDNVNQPVLIQYDINFSWERRPRTVRTVRVSAGRSQQAAMQQTLKTYRKLNLYGIKFDFDKATIRSDAASLISDIATTLELNPNWTLSIRGHTDSIGGVGYNFKLSERRAKAVTASLIRNYGIQPARLRAVGLGPSEPLAANDSLHGRALNRRVELLRTDR